MSRKYINFSMISVLAICLCACGVTGKLETAPPMWGKAKQEYEAQKAKEAAYAAAKAAVDAAAEAGENAKKPPEQVKQ